MKLTALITTLVLGTSSLAMASPHATVTASAEIGFSAGWSTHTTSSPARTQVVVRDHRDERHHRDPAPAPTYIPRGQGGRPVTPRPPVAVVPRPVVYVQPAPAPVITWDNTTPNYTVIANGLNFSASDTRKDIGVSWTGKWNQVHIDALGSAETIQRVAVKFDTGVTQIIEVNQTIRGGQQLTFDLDGINRTVSRVLVYGAPVAGGSYNSAGFSVSLL